MQDLLKYAGSPAPTSNCQKLCRDPIIDPGQPDSSPFRVECIVVETEFIYTVNAR
jgi:hypothetical protein